MSDKRFKLSIHLHVEQTAPEAEAYFDCPLTYPGINYDGVVLVEGLLVQMLEKLVKAGIARTEDPVAVMAVLGVQNQLLPAPPKK